MPALSSAELTARDILASIDNSQIHSMTVALLGLFENAAGDSRLQVNRAYPSFKDTDACVNTAVIGLKAANTIVTRRSELPLDYKDAHDKKHSLGCNQEEVRTSLRGAIATLEQALATHYPTEYQKAVRAKSAEENHK